MSAKSLLLLFDAHALIHRAFHAVKPLTSPITGEPIGAVYGFTSMMLKTLNELKPSHVAVTFDSATPTFRHEKYHEYKANRKKTPDELLRQFPIVHELVEAFNIPIFELSGYEADDLLGTLSMQASRQGIDTIIVTGDSDTLQLVSPNIRVILPKPRKTFSDTIIYDSDRVKERYGLEPAQIPDLKGLMGDASDNIKGVPGIGEKTATKLLQQFGSIENIFAKINDVVPQTVREKLITHEAEALLSKKLATIITEAPVDLDLHACHVSSYNRESVVQLFHKLQFTSMLSKLPQPGEKELTKKSDKEVYYVIDTEELFDELLLKLHTSSSFTFDLETTSPDALQAELVGFSFCIQPEHAWYVPVGDSEEIKIPLKITLEKLKPLFEDPSIAKIAHNGKYDMTVLRNYGIEVKNLNFDTMIAGYLLGEKSLSLKSLAFNELNIEMTPITDLIGSGSRQISMAEVPLSKVVPYACADADMTQRLATIFIPKLHENNLWDLFTEVEMPLISILMRMERVGVSLNQSYLEQLSLQLRDQITAIEVDIYNSIGHQFNINSPQQLAAVLFDELRLPAQKKRSTEASILESLKDYHPVVTLVLEYRQLAKLKSTYVDALPTLINPKTGRVHTSFNQALTVTGRLSSSRPNLQNIPVSKQMRQAFITKKGSLLLAADYSQIELRIMAHLSQDQRLMAAFLNDEDVHTQTAAEVFGTSKEQVTPQMRRVAKTINFGVIYGMSGYGLEQATELSREEASRFIRAYFDKYPGVKAYKERTIEETRKNGFVQTMLGRRRYIPEINASNYQIRSEAERMAVNMPVQGTAADIIKLAMIRVQSRIDSLGLKSKMLLQVHDELLFEVPDNEIMELRGMLLDIMPHAMRLSIPLKIDLKIGKNWGEMEAVNA